MFGLDFTDSGFFLYTQFKISQGDFNDVGLLSTTCGSDIIGALWINLFKEQPSLLFARMGAFIIVYIICIILYFIILEITNNKILTGFSVLLIYFIWPGFKSFPIINYDLAPLLPLSLIYYLTIIIFKKNCNQNQKFLYLILGFSNLILVFTRLPLILPSLLILILMLYFEGESRFINFKYFIVGILFAIVILFLINISRNYLLNQISNIIKVYNGNYANYYKINTDSNYGIKSQIYFWIRGYFRIILSITLIIGISFFINKFQKIIKNRLLQYLTFTIFITSLNFLPIDEIILITGYDRLQFISHFFNYFIIAIFLIISIISLFSRDKTITKVTFIILIYFLLYPLGSNSFEKKLILTIPIFILPSYLIYLKSFKTNKFSIYIEKYISLNYTIKMLFITYIIFSIVNLTNFTPYRESSVKDLNQKCDIEGLINIRTTQKRYQAFSPLYIWFHNENLINKSLLCLDRVSLFNYTLKLNGVFDYPWPLLLDNDFFAKRLNDFEKNKISPDYILLPVVDMSYSDWETTKVPFILNDFHQIFLKKYLQKYQVGYKSDYFIVWKKI
ncbi:MAG: hypothetical protein K9I82_06825 [Chitinophagaceae bacterium]|nr:hypothetical protein [Chitinophagaceae bacterium]